MSVSYPVALACLSPYGMLEALQSERFNVLALADSGERALAAARETRCALLVADYTLPGMDAPALLDALRALRLCAPPRVLLLTPQKAAWHARALSLGADAVLPLPAPREAVQAAALRAMAPPFGALAAPDMPLRRQCAGELLDALGMRPRLKGYAYLREAVALACAAPFLCWEMSARLYPALAAQAGAAAPAVERCIRHALETTWLSGNLSALHALFGASVDPEKGKPTNGEAIALLAEHAANRLRARRVLA